MLAVDPALRQLFDRIVDKLESCGFAPQVPIPSDRDWLAFHVDSGEGHQRMLAELLMLTRDMTRSCPQWVERISTLR